MAVFLSGAKLLEILDPWVCVSHVSSEDTALEASIWGLCRKMEGKLISLRIRILSQGRGSSVLEEMALSTFDIL